MKKILFLLLFTSAMYGQIVPTGQEQDFDYGIKNTASQLDDNAVFITVQNSDGVQGKSTSSVWAKKIYVDNADVKKSFLSTGLIKNGLVQANADPTKFNITAGIGIISNFDDPENPTSTIVNFPAFIGITPTYLTTSNITYIAINSNATIVQQATPFTNIQRRDLIILGAVIHSNLSTINLVNNISAPTNSDTNQLHDLMEAIGALNVDGNKIVANNANLSINKTAGDIFKLGVNFANDWKNPHKLNLPLQTLATFRYRTQNGTEGANVTVLNPALYDVANVLTSVPSNKFSIQTVTLFQTGAIRVQYGQATYATLSEAEAAITTRTFNVEPNIAANGITRAYIILKNTATSLQNASDTKIVEAGKFGNVGGSGGAITLDAIVAALGFTPANDANISGTTNYIAKFTGTKTLGNSSITDNGTLVSTTTDMTVNGVKIGKGTGQISTNTAIGFQALNANTTGANNTAIGYQSLAKNTSGNYNTALGNASAFNNLIGGDNSFFGFQAGYSSIGNFNSFFGSASGYNSLGTSNSFFGYRSALNLVNGNNNVFLGVQAGRFISGGSVNLTELNNSVIIGTNTKPNGNSQTNQTVIGYDATGLGSNTTVLGNSSTVQTWLGGRLTIGSTIDDGSSTFQLTGVAKLNTAPTTSAGTYDILTRNTSTGIVEKVLSSSVVTTGGAIFTGEIEVPSIRMTSGGSIHLNTGGTGFIDDVSGNTFTTGYPTVGWYSNAPMNSTSFIATNGTVRLKNYTVATLPTGVIGDTAYVTDATAPTYLGTLTGGGSVVCPVFYNGSAWVSH